MRAHRARGPAAPRSAGPARRPQRGGAGVSAVSAAFVVGDKVPELMGLGASFRHGDARFDTLEVAARWEFAV